MTQLPLHGEPTNLQRALWAKAALAVFTAETYGGDHPDSMDPGDVEDAVADLICDLLHFAGLHPRMDAPNIHARALRLFEQEIAATTAKRAEMAHLKAPRFVVVDADRLLGLADEFLSNWAEDAVQGGHRDFEYEERAREWDAIRPLLASAPAMRNALEIIAADRDCCTCSTRSWYGTHHDTQCPIRIAREVLSTPSTSKE